MNAATLQLQLQTFGEVSLRSPDGALILENGKPLAVVAYLALADRRTVRRDELIDLLWSDARQAAAQHDLRQAIWYIRKKLGPSALVGTGELTLASLAYVDCLAFQEAVAAGDHVRAVSIYSGDFFQAFAAPGGSYFEQWADLQRTRFRKTFVRSAEEAARAHLRNARFHEAQHLARRIRDDDPFREASWRFLLECLLAGGDQLGAQLEVEALQEFAARESLTLELATKDSIHLAASFPGSDPGPSNTLAAALVGRGREFATLMEAWNGVTKAHGLHVHIVSEPGLGKTRLLAELRQRLQSMRARVVSIRATPGTRDIPYATLGALAAALAPQRGALSISPSSAAALVALNPTLSSLFTASADNSLGDEAHRRRAMAMRELLEAVGDDRPIAVLIDDVHWMDLQSQSALRTILDAPEGVRALVVTTARSAQQGFEGPHSRRIVLSPLDHEAIVALLSSLGSLPSEPWVDDFTRVLEASTGGSPLLLLESLQLLAERGLLIRSTGASASWGSTQPSELLATLAEGSAVRRRITSLDRTDRWLLLLLSAAGVPVTDSALGAMSARPTPDTASRLEALETRGFVSRDGPRWRVAHDEIAAEAYDVASDEMRRTAHAAIGEALVNQGDESDATWRLAAPHLARGHSGRTLAAVFHRFVRYRRRAGDRQSNAALARELLATESTEARTRDVVESLPLSFRVGLYSPARWAALGLATVAVPVIGLIAAQASNQRQDPGPDAVLTVFSGSDSVWEFGHRVEIRARDFAERRGPIVGWTSRGVDYRIAAGTDPRRSNVPGAGWIVSRPVSDSGVIDLFLVARDGSARRLTYSKGDDNQPSVSPDGRSVVYSSGQWSDLSRYDLAVLDLRTGQARQLTSGEDSDTDPQWRADGSMIAFRRRFWDGSAPAFCTINVDGTDLHCVRLADESVQQLLGWYDDALVVVAQGEGGLTLGLVVPNDGVYRRLLELWNGSQLAVSPDGEWVVCHCKRLGYPSSTSFVVSLTRPEDARPLSLEEVEPGAIRFEWELSGNRSYVESIAIRSGLGAPLVHVPHALTVEGFGPEKDLRRVATTRWQSRDTTVATVDAATGILLGRRPGVVTVEATTGGWRSASIELTIRPREVEPVFDEDWSDSRMLHWSAFGEPRPAVVTLDDGSRAFLNNGDGSFVSGAISNDVFPSGDGLSLEFMMSGRVTLPQWQRIDVGLWDAHSGLPSTIDPRRGPTMPPKALCESAWPATEGPSAADSIYYGLADGADGESGRVPAPRGARNGRVLSVRIQLLPDGRCGWALDGKPVGLGSRPAHFGNEVRISLSGSSARTQMVVRRMTLRRGVPDDIDWAAFASERGQPTPEKSDAFRGSAAKSSRTEKAR